MNNFPEIKKNFGFGCMRLPLKGEEIDFETMNRMVDAFIDNGFNYFDTAHMYMNGRSEGALKTSLTSRRKREEYLLVDKLSGAYFNSGEEIRPFFEKQLELCGVDYFDFYLMHCQTKNLFEKFKECKAYETTFELKKEGKVRHVGFSFHDNAEVLNEILSTYPEVEFVQIQFNYLDFLDPSVQSQKCYEVARKHNKPIIIMEPVKGGALINLPEKALDKVKGMGMTPAELAIRFAASFEGVIMVLSGMGSMDMMKENTAFMKEFKPLSEEEKKKALEIAEIIRDNKKIPCTSCEYCIEGCPMNINIPALFSCKNEHLNNSWVAKNYYITSTQNRGKASDCIECGACESACPQHLKIRELLKDVSETFED